MAEGRGFLGGVVPRCLEAAALWLGYGLFAGLPLDAASNLGGWIARAIGPRLKVSNVAIHNLGRVFPEKTDAEITAIVRGVWDNLGRVVAELPHIARMGIFDDDRFTVSGLEHIEHLRDDGAPGLVFTAHFGNWELPALAARQRGLDLSFVYRAANRPTAERLIRLSRRWIADNLIAKGGAGARQSLSVLMAGGHLGILPDQKMNDGIAVPFFGRDAMTAPALARLAHRFDCPVVPLRAERTGGARFHIRFYPPLEIPHSGDRQADVLALMTEVNRIIEGWIRERPEQWLWLHRRWPD